MKALRYILSLIAIVSVMGMSAATYGTSHQPRYRRVVYHQVEARTDMPVATMSPMYSTVMQSGSSLPLAAATGVTTSYDSNPAKAPSRPRRVGEDDGFEDDDDPPVVPANPYPIGDGMWVMILLAGAYLIWRATRRRALSR